MPELDGWSTGPLDALKGEDALRAAAKLVQEELCLVKETTREDVVRDGGDVAVDFETSHVFEAGVVCFSFDATKRRGKTLGDIHVPVPGYEEKMRAAVARVFAGLKHDKPLWRANWALQNSGAFCARVRFSPTPRGSTFDRVGPFQLTDARTHRIARIRRDRVHEPRVAPDQPRHRRRDKQSGGRGEDRRPGC